MANYTKKEQFDLIRSGKFGYEKLKEIDNQYEDVCMEALKISANAIEYINNPTEEMKIIAVKNWGHTIRHINNPTEEMKLLAIKNNGWAIRYIEGVNYEGCFNSIAYMLENLDKVIIDYENSKIKNVIFLVAGMELEDYFPEYDIEYNGLKIDGYNENGNNEIFKLPISIFNKLKKYLINCNSDNCFIFDNSVDIETFKEFAVTDNTLIYLDYNEDNSSDLYKILANKTIGVDSLLLR